MSEPARSRLGDAPVGGFVQGLLSPLEALGFLARHRGLWPYAAAPFALSILLLGGLIAGAAWLTYTELWDWIGGQAEETSDWLVAIRWILVLTAIVLTIGVATFVFRVIVMIVAAPFHDLLSERVERVLLGKSLDEPFSWKRLLVDLLRPVVDVLKLLAYQLLLLAVFLPVLLVPAVGGLLYSALLCYIAAMDYLDVPMARHRMSLAQKRALLKTRRLEVLGLGVTSTLALLIPIVNFAIIPIGVIAGTITYHRLIGTARSGGSNARDLGSERGA